jgi:hypothetical protein|tara:strand:- start:72 stop:389 length:318 start_codon:yes stop_codon:yes gene_type:complete
MATPLGGSPIEDTHFKFLKSPSVGRGGTSLSTVEAKRFVAMGRQLSQCANWKKKVDRDIFDKIIKVIETAYLEADNNCGSLPFSLPEESSTSVYVSTKDYRAPEF